MAAEAGRPDASPPPRPRRRRGPISPLVRRVLVVNLFALLILVGGIFYLTQFRERLIERRLEQLQIQADILAGAIGESATGGPEASSIDKAAARQIIGRLVGPTETRARLFDLAGNLMVDSRFLASSRAVIAENLPPLGASRSLEERFLDLVNELLDLAARRPDVAPYSEAPQQHASDYIEVVSALAGEPMTQIRRLDEDTLLLSAAVPVQRFRRVLGALMLSADTEDIEDIVRAEQITILKVFGISFAITLLLSIFLASTIARPVRKLAQAAEHVRYGLGREQTLPQIERNDEIGDLSATLKEMTEALYRQIDATEAFAADVAHELKNPLSSLRSAVESLGRTRDESVQARLLAIIAEDVRRLDRLITDISDASRLDAELTRGRMEEVDLGALVATLVDAYRSRDAGGGVTIVFAPPPAGRFRVRGLESRLGQVIANLIDNAISFCPAGATVTVTLSRKGDHIELVVEDEGPGLPADADRIFERFYSERPDQEAFGTHSGLGLSISKQIVEAHRGTIRAENRVEPDAATGESRVLGARFIVTLPRA
ncbi:MAG: HAMP domain-containing protein [Alphaproteobacteria bacterium]|nr:MAG: HAMP domain-containing protein [Alphaproteobacteria bacterium]